MFDRIIRMQPRAVYLIKRAVPAEGDAGALAELHYDWFVETSARRAAKYCRIKNAAERADGTQDRYFYVKMEVRRTQ